MTAEPTPIARNTSWQTLLAEAIKDPVSLVNALGLTAEQVGLDETAAGFPLRVPRPYVDRMRHGDPADPLLRQVLPSLEELKQVPGYITDPLQEAPASPEPGVIHKYHGRVLLIVTGACAVHCRYCFRRHFPYQAHQRSSDEWQKSLAYIAADSSISEVILSGGDPLALNDKRLAQLLDGLAAIPHVKRLRLHTRLPIVLPQRITPELVTLLAGPRFATSLVVHCNHARELDASVGQSLALLREAGITLLNQAVLLRGVNDSAALQAALSERLFDYGVLPYYLHLLDAVAGAAHFSLPETQAIEIHKELLKLLPGYLVPRLVREIPGEPHKTPIN